MESQIQAFLDRITTEKGMQILLAVESGSRAWGFPSPDSDYDIRFIYRHPLDWYLTILNRKDTIERMTDDRLLDGMGWDLRKVLSLAFASNVSPFEWLQSPTVYREEPGFRDGLWETILPYFSPRAAVHHYLGIAEGISRREWKGEEVKIKRYFYVLRPVLSARWVWIHKSPPPTVFAELLPLLEEHAPHLRRTVAELLEQKAAAPEDATVDRLPELETYLLTQLDEGRLRASGLPVGHRDEGALDAFYRKVVKG
ncbi:MAG: nucleotidyltransferase domain-containing protein [Lewinella sp.]|nr:nucleotidyltransferase domain-containing protein [Lewinella sp.]